MIVFYTCDDNFIWLAAISMCSLFENNRNADEIKVFLFGDNVSIENKQKLANIAKSYIREFEAIDVADLNIPSVLCSNRWPKSAYTRIFAASLMPKDVHKAIYLDCDTIVCSDISDLWSINSNDYYVSGVLDCIGKYYKENIGLDGNSKYINAGVLLMNIDKFRELNINNMINCFFERHQEAMTYADQDVLNGLFKGEVGVLEPKYDVMTLGRSYSYNDIIKLRRPTHYYSEKELQEAIKKPAILHFTTCMLSVRPWYANSQHPDKDMFLHYMSLTPWANRNLPYMNFTGPKNMFLKIINVFPKFLRIRLLGFIHSTLLPIANRFKNKI